MIDVHSHIIPNIDDGSSSTLETFMMLKEAEKAGFTDIIATPHYIAEATEQVKEDVINQINEINQAAREQGIHVKLHPGEEVYTVPNLADLIKQEKIVSLNQSKYILIEFAMHDKPKFIENIIFELCNLGYIPVIAHPERYDYIKKDLNMVSNWQNMGALIQCNYGSLIGKYGHTAQKLLIKLLKNKQVDFMGSDCHRAGSIYDDMFEITKKFKKVVDDDYFEIITTSNAKRLLLN